METLELNIDGNIAKLSFNRPDYLNSYNWQMSEELPDCLEDIAENNNIDVVLLSGNGKAFMAGGDVNFLQQGAKKENSEYTRTAILHLNRSIEILSGMKKIVVSAVHGSAAGAGISLMLASDIIIAHQNTKFNLAYLNLGLTPDGGLSYLLPRAVGSKKAAELLLLSELFDAEFAAKIGLVNFICDDNTYESKISSIINKLSKGPKIAQGKAKMLLNKSWDNNLESQLAAETTSFLDCCATPDFAKRVANFLSKQK